MMLAMMIASESLVSRDAKLVGLMLKAEEDPDYYTFLRAENTTPGYLSSYLG
jgi:hypothetical protein